MCNGTGASGGGGLRADGYPQGVSNRIDAFKANNPAVERAIARSGLLDKLQPGWTKLEAHHLGPSPVLNSNASGYIPNRYEVGISTTSRNGLNAEHTLEFNAKSDANGKLSGISDVKLGRGETNYRDVPQAGR